MQSQHGKQVSQAERIPIVFWSNCSGKYGKLSNFHHLKEGILFRGRTFPSSEHAFQSCFVPEDMKDCFTVSGTFGDYYSGFKSLYPSASSDFIQKKVDYWKKKNNIGILAKMAVNRKRLGSMNIEKKSMSFEECEDTFFHILQKKFEIPDFKNVLLSTGKCYLLEFDRFQQESEDKISRWGGKIINHKVWGHNQMGSLLMKVRDTL